MKLKNWKNKFVKLKNGLRAQIMGANDNGNWVLKSVADNQTWAMNPNALQNAIEITEKEAGIEFVKMEERPVENVEDLSFWKIGRKELVMKFPLRKGKSPIDEANRIQKEMRIYFEKFDANLLPYVNSCDGGIEVVFLSRMPEKINDSTEPN